jgi:hypothetical protein
MTVNLQYIPLHLPALLYRPHLVLQVQHQRMGMSEIIYAYKHIVIIKLDS